MSNKEITKDWKRSWDANVKTAKQTKTIASLKEEKEVLIKQCESCRNINLVKEGAIPKGALKDVIETRFKTKWSRRWEAEVGTIGEGHGNYMEKFTNIANT